MVCSSPLLSFGTTPALRANRHSWVLRCRGLYLGWLLWSDSPPFNDPGSCHCARKRRQVAIKHVAGRHQAYSIPSEGDCPGVHIVRAGVTDPLSGCSTVISCCRGKATSPQILWASVECPAGSPCGASLRLPMSTQLQVLMRALRAIPMPRPSLPNCGVQSRGLLTRCCPSVPLDESTTSHA